MMPSGRDRQPQGLRPPALPRGLSLKTPHASLVAREYAIPAVVATGNATLRLHSGQLVTVDGSVGTVTPHDEHITDQR